MRLFEYELDLGGTIHVDKLSKDGTVTILVREVRDDKDVVIAYFKYKDIGYEVGTKAPDLDLLNWENIILCSNWYAVAPQPKYMNHAVQNGLKTAATAYPYGKDTEESLIETCPEDCSALSMGGMVFICRNGCLRDYFDFDQVKSAYEDRGVMISGYIPRKIDWFIVSDYFDMPLIDFSSEEKCGIDIQNGGSNELLIVNGLVLGYPVESTVAYIEDSLKAINKPRSNKVPEEWQDISNYM